MTKAEFKEAIEKLSPDKQKQVEEFVIKLYEEHKLVFQKSSININKDLKEDVSCEKNTKI